MSAMEQRVGDWRSESGVNTEATLCVECNTKELVKLLKTAKTGVSFLRQPGASFAKSSSRSVHSLRPPQSGGWHTANGRGRHEPHVADCRVASRCGAAPARTPLFAPSIQAACDHYGIAVPLDIAAFLVQIGHESGALAFTREIWGVPWRSAPTIRRRRRLSSSGIPSPETGAASAVEA